jgi:hypothetical protein
MKYPALSDTKTTELAAQLVGGRDPAIDPHVEWVGHGDEVDLEPVTEIAAEITQNAREWTDKDRDRFEGKASIQLLKALAHVPTPVLDDRGFWRFLSIRHFWEFIAWREEGPFSKGNQLKYVDAARSTESVLPRMYLRARAVGGGSYADLAAAVAQGTDFWRSHVLRVRSGSAPSVTRAFVRKQMDARLMTDSLRQAARRLNRTWANVVLHVYDDSEASELIGTIWDQGDDD